MKYDIRQDIETLFARLLSKKELQQARKENDYNLVVDALDSKAKESFYRYDMNAIGETGLMEVEVFKSGRNRHLGRKALEIIDDKLEKLSEEDDEYDELYTYKLYLDGLVGNTVCDDFACPIPVMADDIIDLRFH